MPLKHIYFVRHGESEYNVSDTILHHDTDLTAKGLSQAQHCAARCAHLDVEVIIASPLLRAQRTAHAISTTTNKRIITGELFTEYRYPESIIGMKKRHGLYEALINGSEKGYPGGEIFADLMARAKLALASLEEREETSILVVSHAMFLHALQCEIVFGDTATSRDFEQFFHRFRLGNTGITHCTWNNEQPEGEQWSIVTWNDDAHLGAL